MDMQQTYRDGFGGRIAGLQLDGLGGQEDELEDVSNGKLDPHGTGTSSQKLTLKDKAKVDEEEIQADLETRTPG